MSPQLQRIGTIIKDEQELSYPLSTLGEGGAVMGLNLDDMKMIESILKDAGVSPEGLKARLRFAKRADGFMKVLEKFSLDASPAELQDMLLQKSASGPPVEFDCGRMLTQDEIPNGFYVPKLAQLNVFSGKVTLRSAAEVEDFILMRQADEQIKAKYSQVKGRMDSLLRGRLLLPASFAFDLTKNPWLVSRKMKKRVNLFWTILCKKSDDSEHLFGFTWTGDEDYDQQPPLVISLKDSMYPDSWTVMTSKTALELNRQK